MTALYALTNQYLALAEKLSDGDFDAATIADTIEASGINDEIAEKAQGLEYVARGAEAHNLAIDAEIARLQALKQHRMKVAAGLRGYLLDNMGGMWIRLTVCGVTRLGYGDAGTKSGGDAIKEVIGDALRNAAMRFGAALDLWHKGDLHGDDEGTQGAPEPAVDLSPKARAERIRLGVASGDAGGAAIAMAGWETDLLNEVWALLDPKVQEKLTAAWPK